jgi:hypothetical protein
LFIQQQYFPSKPNRKLGGICDLPTIFCAPWREKWRARNAHHSATVAERSRGQWSKIAGHEN